MGSCIVCFKRDIVEIGEVYPELYSFIIRLIRVDISKNSQHQLYNYQNKLKNWKSIVVNEESYILCTEDGLKNITNEHFKTKLTDSYKIKFLLFLENQGSHFVVYNKSYQIKTLENNSIYFWKFVNEKTKLQTHSIFKLGKLQFKVRKIHLYQQSSQSQPVMDSPNSCRICLSSKQSKHNPLISPCNCTGSLAFIHIYCMRTWMSHSTQIENINENSYCLKLNKMECQLCKTILPQVVLHQNQEYELYEVISLPKPYVVIELYSKRNKKIKCNHALKDVYGNSFYQKNNIKIGRSSQSQIKVFYDGSISRNHCILSFQNVFSLNQNIIYLQDENSKYGSLILWENSIKIDKNTKNSFFQIETCLLSLALSFRKGKFQQDKIPLDKNGQEQFNLLQKNKKQYQSEPYIKSEDLLSQESQQLNIDLIHYQI